MPLDARYRFHLRSAYAWLGLWGLWMALTLVWGTDPSEPPAAMVHFALLGVGFAGNLLLGLAHHLATHFAPRPALPPWVLALESVATSLAAASATAWLLVDQPPAWLERAASLAWAAALLAFALGLIAQGRAPRREPMAAYQTQLPGDKTSSWLLWAAVTYAALAALLSAGLGMLQPPTVHAWLAGVVATSVFMVAHRVLPRFSNAWLPPWFHQAQGVLAALGPLALVAALWMGSGRPLAAMGGLLELAAILLHAAIAGFAWKHRRNQHPAVGFPALGAVFLVAGALLGVAMLDLPGHFRFVALHAANNLVGFVVLTALGMGAAMLGLGVAPLPGRPNRHVWRAGVALAVSLLAWEATALLQMDLARDAATLALASCASVQAAWGLRLRFGPAVLLSLQRGR